MLRSALLSSRRSPCLNGSAKNFKSSCKPIILPCSSVPFSSSHGPSNLAIGTKNVHGCPIYKENGIHDSSKTAGVNFGPAGLRTLSIFLPLFQGNENQAKNSEELEGEESGDDAKPEKSARSGVPAKKEILARHLDKDRSKVIPLETSIRYMKSPAYLETYGNSPVWVPYRRNFPGQFAPKKTRISCVKPGTTQLQSGNPCPICRDEYLVIHHENVGLLQQFILPHNGSVIGYDKTGVCQHQHERLVMAIQKAKDYGIITFDVPFREYDYKEYDKIYASY